MNLCIIGTGYVGLVTGAIFSHLGYNVVCVDKVVEKIEGLKQGVMPIHEDGLKEIVASNSEAGRLSFSVDLPSSVRHSDVIFICVGTPPGADGAPEMKYVRAVAEEIAQGMNDYKIVVNKSTVPVGTGEMVRAIIADNLKEPIPFDVVSNPEFLREGSAIYDTLNPDRVVIGATNRDAGEKVASLYATLTDSIHITDVASAELIKYASNSFLATKISFMNAVSALCELTGADVEEVKRGVGQDKRIGSAFLNAGLGFGGSCFPKDCLGLYHTAKKYNYDFHLMASVLKVNEEQPLRFLARLRTVLNGFEGKRIGLWGLAFKPNTDDIRDGKAFEIMKVLLAEGAEVVAYDPIAIENSRKEEPRATYAETALEVCNDADALLLVTEWQEFLDADLGEVKRRMRLPVFFDGRNAFTPSEMREKGFVYCSIGRSDA